MFHLGRIVLGFTLILALIAGCDKKDASQEPGAGGPPMGGPPGPSPEEVLAKLPGGEEHAAGKKVYAVNKCASCHRLGETGGKMGGPPGMTGNPPGMPMPGGPEAKGPPGGVGFKGKMGGGTPDLTNIGASEEHTKEWIVAHIRDPKTHKPMSRMPAYGPDKINDADLEELSKYLASRKEGASKERPRKADGK